MINIDEKEIKFAILFEKIDSELGFSFYMPRRPMIGYATEDRTTFTELVSGQEYLNFYNERGLDICLDEGFECMDSVESVINLTKKGSIEEALPFMWNQIKNNVYFYGSLTLGGEEQLVSVPIEEFYRDFFNNGLMPSEMGKVLNLSFPSSTTQQETLNLKPGRVIYLFNEKKE